MKIYKKILHTITQWRTALFCSKGKHKWEYYTVGSKYVKKYDLIAMNVPMRCCKVCDRYEESLEGKWEEDQ